ncbi:YfbM family protein [Micromonospora sp. NPDC049679]|uniref:YfbM family protein n=1 Tax=Micromonospora sp. NPDC049679 TaxID=3155920 RepID=UPI003402DF55
MNGNWLRVTPAELTRAKDDLDWARSLADAAMDAEDGRLDGTDKAWDAFDFLLRRRGVDLGIVHGAEAFVDTPDEEPDDDEWLEDLEHDWGYGPPRYLTPEQVAAASEVLNAVTEEELSRGVDQAELGAADVYPAVWDRPDQLGWVTHHLPYAQRFFAAAAKEGDAIICWLD